MTQKTTKNGVIDENTIRISFILNVKHNPELAYLMALEGHGDRPRELVRLAVIGVRNEEHVREITATVRANEMRKVAARLASSERHQPAPVSSASRAQPQTTEVFETPAAPDPSAQAAPEARGSEPVSTESVPGTPASVAHEDAVEPVPIAPIKPSSGARAAKSRAARNPGFLA